MNPRSTSTSVGLLIVTACAAPVAAEEDSWETSLVVYGQAANLSGTMAVGTTSADVDV